MQAKIATLIDLPVERYYEKCRQEESRLKDITFYLNFIADNADVFNTDKVWTLLGHTRNLSAQLAFQGSSRYAVIYCQDVAV